MVSRSELDSKFYSFEYPCEFSTAGTGYEMTVSTDGNNEDALTSTIQRLVPGSEKEHQSASGITYKLPLTETAKFPELFYTLEQRKDEFGIKNIGVACTTMDRVFLK